jgi:hypothetical protein
LDRLTSRASPTADTDPDAIFDRLVGRIIFGLPAGQH